MSETVCSCCKIFGKPPASINFIITTGQPNSLIHARIKNLLKNYSEIPSYENDVRLTDYESLNNTGAELFNLEKNSQVVDQKVSTKTCCHGFTTMPVDIDDISNKSELDNFREDIRDLLGSKSDPMPEESDIKTVQNTWIMISGFVCLESEILKIFLQFREENSSYFTFSFTILCFLVDEQRLFENWFFQNQPFDTYQSITYPEYERRIRNFFRFLNSSKLLQQNTFLINEQHVSTDNELLRLLQSIYLSGSSNCRATNDQYCHRMAQLLSPCERKARDLRIVRNNLQRYYNRPVQDRLTPLLNQLKEKTTSNAIIAARQISYIVLDECSRMNDQERRVYKRQLALGFKKNDVENCNTITAELIHLALYLITTNDDQLTPLIYSIARVICRLGEHFIFRHQIFNNTPEIFQLSLVLINKRHYPLTLAGFRLCKTILDGDQIEHKYALEYLKHDPASARKILDAVRWILSPYLNLSNLWKEERNREEEEQSEHSRSTDEESAVEIAEKSCFHHTHILVIKSYIGAFASLFYGSTDHCVHVTKYDIEMFADVIEVLADSRAIRWSRGENKPRLSLVLISELCELMTPILLHGSSPVHAALLMQYSLFKFVPKTIEILLQMENTKEDMIKVCLRFYTHLVQAKSQQLEPVHDVEEEEPSEQLEQSTAPVIENSTGSLLPLNLSKDLISAYFDLHCQIDKICKSDDKSEQHEQFQKLLEEEWKKIDIVQLKCDYKHLNDKQLLLEEEMTRLQSELERTRADRDQLRQENRRLAEEIDRQKRSPTTTITTTESNQSSISAPTANKNQINIVEKLKNLSPEEITLEQAEQCIQEIGHRRRTFNEPDMRNSICGSLKHLGSDLYSSPVHFLHELIQNAEDNCYANTIVPCLRIELDHSYILLSNNEKGLRAEDILAICSLAVSTKIGQQDQLGEKGVGFKSVFAASNQPTLMSHSWRFYFRVPGDDAMSYITPLWLKDEEIPDCIIQQISVHPRDTYLYLPLKLQPHTTDAEIFLKQVITAADPCVLLNMRHLKKLEIFDKRENKLTLFEKHLVGPTNLGQKSGVTFENFSFIDIKGDLIKLCHSSSEDMFRVYTCYINVPSSIEQRRSPTTRLILAFPCKSDYLLTSTVYTGLPVCDLGFNFLFNADFQLVTNRENVRENAPFNILIRDHLAVLFVYLLLNDSDLRKDFHQYCPSTDIHQLKHSSWWRTMIDDIGRLTREYLPDLLGIGKDKEIRYSNADLATLVSNDQLYNCADIRIIDSDTSFLTPERLKSFKIRPVSIADILNCFPNQDETPTINRFRQEFRLWAENKEKNWWSQLFHQINRAMTSELFDFMLQKPIFLWNHNHQRQYLPSSDNQHLLLFLSDDISFESWKRQLTLLQYTSESEKQTLLKSKKVQRITEPVLIKIIRDDHLQLAVTSLDKKADPDLINEIWKDLLYLRSHVDKLDKTSPFLVPVQGTINLSIIQNAILPTILGADIRSCMHSTTSPIINLPYYNTDRCELLDILQWEYFLLEMKCQRPSIYIPSDLPITTLPLLPSFTMFTNQESVRLGQSILSAHSINTKECLRQFPIIHYSKDTQQICQISAVFDESIIRDLASLPRIPIPSHCRILAINLGAHVECDIRTCITILQLLSDEKNTDVDHYIQWLGHLQLYLCQQSDEIDSKSLLASFQLYLPDQNSFYSLKDLLIIPDNKDHHESILLVCKYLKLQWISPTNNQIYWQFKDLFRRIGCTCSITINHICNTLHRMTSDKKNFYALGDCNTILTDSSMEMMTDLLQYLEALILACVKETPKNEDLYRAVIENKPLNAPCGSRADMEWRFSLTCNNVSKQLKNVTDIKSRKQKISLPTIDHQLIAKTSENIVYCSLEMRISQNLSKDVGKRYFISPVVTRTCPLVLATFDIDYVERRGKVQWIHENQNVEFQLNELTNVFRDVVQDSQLQVLCAKYARVNLLLSDSFVIDSITEENEEKIDEYTFDSNSPFWIFGKIILLCFAPDIKERARVIITTSALTTLLHKRQYIPLEQAKLIAQEKISTCRAFYSDLTSSIAGTKSVIYSYCDMLFPTDHQSIESMAIQIGKTIIEQDPEDEPIATDQVVTDRTAQYLIYGNRVQTQDHTSRKRELTADWSDSTIVDGQENIRIGENAEFFFFVYLQDKYGKADVTPSKNWRSSTRLAFYQQYRRNIDDSAGFDFELNDTRQIFARSSQATTKKCYFEVKGTSGSFNEEHTRFNISRNELELCEAIAENSTRKEQEAYFIVIVENCLDHEKISLAAIIEWSSNLNQIYRTVNSYQCRIESSPFNNDNNVSRKIPNQDNPQKQRGFPTPNNRGTPRTPYNSPRHHNQQTRGAHGSNSATSSWRQSTNNYSSSTCSNTFRGNHNRNNEFTRQQRATNATHSSSFFNNPFPHPNQQRQNQPYQHEGFYNNDQWNNPHHQDYSYDDEWNNPHHQK